MSDLLQQLRAKGYELRLTSAGNIDLEAPYRNQDEIDLIRASKPELILALQQERDRDILFYGAMWLKEKWISPEMFDDPSPHLTDALWQTMNEWYEMVDEYDSKYSPNECPIGGCDCDTQPVWCKHCSSVMEQQLSLN